MGGKEEGRRTERGSFPSPIFFVSKSSFGAFLFLFLGSFNPLSVSNRGYASSYWVDSGKEETPQFLLLPLLLPFCNCSLLLLLPLPGSLPGLWMVHNYRVMSGQVLKKHLFTATDLFQRSPMISQFPGFSALVVGFRGETFVSTKSSSPSPCSSAYSSSSSSFCFFSFSFSTQMSSL